MQEARQIDIIANTMIEPGLSGGNRIFIELAKEWLKKGIAINVFTSSQGEEICEKNGLDKVNFYVWKIPKLFSGNYPLSRIEIFLLYFYGIIRGLFLYFNLRRNKKQSIVWTTSDYWPDSLIGIFSKLFKNNSFWVGSLFLFAPNPLIGFKEKGRLSLPSIKNLLFYITQGPITKLTKRLANLIFVTSQPDKDKFVKLGRKKDSVLVIKGGVNSAWADKYLKSKQMTKKVYDACFIGRFHPQKGVLELVDIWSEVCRVKKGAKLIMIGHGELENAVKKKIRQKGLSNNILIKGFLADGDEKFDVFKKSRIVLHPAVYDSGGMAAAEAMAWGLPGVSFDLEALKTYYPYGMLKAKINDIKDFSCLILKLLQNDKLYYNTAAKARELILKEWSWENKAEDIEKIIFFD